MNLLAEGWSYESPDPDAGLQGGYVHDCPTDNLEPPTVTETAHRYEGAGFDRTIVITYSLACPCGATTSVNERHWDPEPGTEES